MHRHRHRQLTGALRVAALLAVLPVAACGGQAGGGTTAAADSQPVVSTPSAPVPCGATTGLGLPRGWPEAVPLPAGFVVTTTEQRSGNRMIATGRVPGDFHGVVDFFTSALPRAGFSQKDSQVDPADAESDFGGKGRQGRWTVRDAPDCPGQTQLSVLVGPESTEKD